MVALRFERVLALPAVATPNTIYFVRPTGAEIALQYVTGNDGVPVLVGGAATVTPTPTPTPAPVFATQPSLSPSYVIAGSPISITPGVVTGGAITTRAALLNGAALPIVNNQIATAGLEGTVTYQETATGPDGQTTSSMVRTATVAAVTPTPAAAYVGPTGAELAFTPLDFYGTGFPFLDHFKSSQWTAPDSSGNQVPVTLNSDGYPTAIPSGATKLQCLINVEGGLGPSGVEQRYVIETNKLDMVFTISNGGTLSNITDVTTNGVRRYSFTLGSDAPADSGNGSFRVDLNATSLPTPFGAGDWIRMPRADQKAALDAGGIFKPEYLASFAPYNNLRFMDWVPANRDAVRSWADRPKLSWGSWTSPKGVPFEIMVALCNATNKHMYINFPATLGVTGVLTDDGGNNPLGRPMPTTVSDDITIAYQYIDNMAALIDSTLNSGLLCVVEPSNERWNYGFVQYYYYRSFRPALVPGGTDYQEAWAQAGYRDTRLMGRFMKAVNYSSRFIPVSPTFALDVAVTDNNMMGADKAIAEWSNPSHANYDAALGARYKTTGQLYTGGIGITAYFHGGIIGTNTSANDRAKVIQWADATDDSGILALIRQLDIGDQLEWGSANSLAAWGAQFAGQFARAQARQMPKFNYEGNFEITGEQMFPDPADVAKRIKLQGLINRAFAHPAMRDLMAKKSRTVRQAGIYNDVILADKGNVGDTYATQTSAYGAPTPRTLGLLDFAASPGDGVPLAITLAPIGPRTAGTSATTAITTSGGVGRVYVTVSTLTDGRTFDGFRTISGTFTTPGTYTVTVTATDDAGSTPATDSETFTVSAPVANGKRYFRLVSIGTANNQTSDTIANGNNQPSLSEVYFRNDDGSNIPLTAVTVTGDEMSPGEPLAALIDSDVTTFWTGVTGKTNYTVFDFGVGGGAKPASILMQDRAENTGRAPGDFAWEWSDDGTNWTQIYRTIIRGGSTPGNAVFGNTGNGFNGAYENHQFIATMSYPA